MTSAVLSIPAAAVYIGVSERTMYRLAAECGTGPTALRPARIRGRRVFRVVDLDAYLERQTQTDGRRAS